MDSRFAAVAAVIVGSAIVIAAGSEYLLPGIGVAPAEPFATGLFVVAAGLLLIGLGAHARSANADNLALRATTVVGVLTLVAVVIQPNLLLFGGVFWLGVVSFGLIAAGSYRTLIHAVEESVDKR